MNVTERIKQAYENVSLDADRTWTYSPNVYQKSNLALYLTEQHVRNKKFSRYRPRNVRECIPKSRLAQYSNFVYNESREMSYASSSPYWDTNLSIHSPTECWEMSEVGELYRWFLNNQPEDDFCRLEGYESPLLSVSGFQDKILKIQISEDRVKNIWKKNHQRGFHTKSGQIRANLATSPMKNFFVFNSETDCNHEWFRNISITKDFKQLKQLTKSFQEQAVSISKFSASNKEPVATNEQPPSTEILYSEVLQGRKFASHKSETREETSDNFTNYTVLNSQRSDESSKSDNFTSKVSSVPQTSNKFVPQKTSTANVYFQPDTQSYPRYKPTSQFPVDSAPRHTRTVNPFLQQTYFYPQVQRWMPNFSSYYPSQIFPPGWFAPNANNRGFGPPVYGEDNLFKEDVELDFLEEYPVSTSVSEELEIQALEQYSNSNENFYQELERQATEQYSNSPE